MPRPEPSRRPWSAHRPRMAARPPGLSPSPARSRSLFVRREAPPPAPGAARPLPLAPPPAPPRPGPAPLGSPGNGGLCRAPPRGRLCAPAGFVCLFSRCRQSRGSGLPSKPRGLCRAGRERRPQSHSVLVPLQSVSVPVLRSRGSEFALSELTAPRGRTLSGAPSAGHTHGKGGSGSAGEGEGDTSHCVTAPGEKI